MVVNLDTKDHLGKRLDISEEFSVTWTLQEWQKNVQSTGILNFFCFVQLERLRP